MRYLSCAYFSLLEDPPKMEVTATEFEIKQTGSLYDTTGSRVSIRSAIVGDSLSKFA
jgi:hypothetical protein